MDQTNSEANASDEKKIPEILSNELKKDENNNEYNVKDTFVENLHGQVITAADSMINTITADQLDMKSCFAEIADSHIINAQESFILFNQTENLNATNSPSGLVYTQNANINGNVGVLVSDKADLHNSRNAVLVANDVRGDTIKTTVLLAKQVNAPVQTSFDSKGILILGAVIGAVFALLSGIIKLLMQQRH